MQTNVNSNRELLARGGLADSRGGCRTRWVVTLGTLLVVAVLLWLAAGCTVAPPQVHSAQPSYDGNRQDSGLIAFLPDGSAFITPHARDRYTNLLANYGRRLELPPKSPEEGLIQSAFLDGTNVVPGFVMDAQHLNYFKAMNRWRKEAPSTNLQAPK